MQQLTAADFEPVVSVESGHRLTRPSRSYWQDAWSRLRRNRRAIASLWIVIALALFTIAGPWVWRVDPATQDVDQISIGPRLPVTATIVEPYAGWSVPTLDSVPATAPTEPTMLDIVGGATTQAVRLIWTPVAGASGYRVYRNISDPRPDRALGLPLGDILDPRQVGYEDRFDLDEIRYWYSLVALDANGRESEDYAVANVLPPRVATVNEAIANSWIAADAAPAIGTTVELPFHPLGTDYLGRDMLARLMYGARVSLFIGVVAPLAFVAFGIIYGSLSGFVGTRLDHLLMRFADFVVALPFLLFMILFKIAFGIGPGESGVVPMLIALVLLAWPATARLVRGQVLQIRQEGYISASRLLGARTGYLIFRHMIPNAIGVILVTLTFEVPRVIFIEAFLSFIGMGVAPPTPSWGSMSNEGIRTMLSHPHELLFPALFISITVLAFNLLGDGLRDALDVRMRGTE